MENPSGIRRQIGAGRHLRKAVALLGAACGLLFFPVSADAAPRRIVSTFLCTDEYVFRLVDPGHIAALSFEAGDRHPVVSTIADKVGGIAQIRPSTETVLNLQPDLVVMYAGTNARLHSNLAALGVPVLDVPWDNSLANIRRTTRWLGQKFGAQAKAEAMIATMDATLAAAHRAAPRPSIRTLIYEPRGYATNGAVARELMTLAGLVNAAPAYAIDRTGTIPVEEVIAVAPQLLILSGQRTAVNARADLVLHHPALATLEGKTYSAWDPLIPLLCPGPWSVDAATTFAALGDKARLLGKRQAHN